MSFLKKKTVALVVMLSFFSQSLGFADWKEQMKSDLHADIISFDQNLEPYLRSSYSNILDQHNLKRLYDYFALYQALLDARDRTLLDYRKSLDELSFVGSKKVSASELPVTYGVTLTEKLQHFRGAMGSFNRNVNQYLHQAEELKRDWDRRAGSDVTDNLVQLFDFKNTFHQPFIRPNNSRNGYAFVLDLKYNPGTSKTTYINGGIETVTTPISAVIRVAQGIAVTTLVAPSGDSDASVGTNFAIMLVAMVALKIIDSTEQEKHEDDIDSMVGDLSKVIESKRESLALEQSQLIQKSIIKVMPDKISKTFVFSKALQGLISEFKALRDHIGRQSGDIEVRMKDAGAEFDANLARMANADAQKIVKHEMDLRAKDLELMRAFHKEATTYINESGAKIFQSIEKPSEDKLAKIDQDYSALTDVMVEDAVLSADFLTRDIYRDEVDYFFNDRSRFKGNYPYGPWSEYVQEFMSVMGDRK